MALPKNLITGCTACFPADYKRQADEPKRKREKPQSGKQNKTEAAYDWELSLRKTAGDIRYYWYPAPRLWLADRTTYQPDFLVWHNDGSLEMVEIKGFLECDAAVKFKVARELYPCFKFTMLRRERGAFVEILSSREAAGG
jgi:hypothetical protein